MNSEKTPTRTELRRTRRAAEAISTGADPRDVARLLRVRTSTAKRLARALTGKTTTKGEPMEYTEAQFPGVDLSDERNLMTKIGGEPVILTPQPDGTIRLTRRSDAPSLDAASLTELTELVGNLQVINFEDAALREIAENATSFADLAEQLAELSEGEPEDAETEEEAGVDLAAAESFYQQWRAYAAEQGVDLALSVGDAVEWGQGQGQGHGIVQELDTAEGWAIIHTCEVIAAAGDKPAGLSPTGRTIKIEASKLRASTLPLVGENPVGPELSADLSGDVAGGGGGLLGESAVDQLSEDELQAQLDKDLEAIRGGHGS